MRIGEILLQEGVITPTQLESALATQHQRGRRVGSTMVELGWLHPDVLARALGKQLGVSPALSKHFAQIDPRVLRRLPAKLAVKHLAVPLGFSAKHARTLIVAFVAPNDAAALQEIGFAVGARVQPSVASEHVVRAMLSRHYRAGSSPPAFFALDAGNARDPSDDAPEILGNTPPQAPISRPSDAGSRAANPSSPRLVATNPSQPRLHLSLPPPAEVIEASSSPPPSLGEPLPTSAPPVSGTRSSEQPAELHVGVGIEETLDRLARATIRDEIGDALTDYLLSAFDLGLVLIAKDQLALGWKGFASSVDATIIESVSIPLVTPSAFAVAHDTKRVFIGAPPPEGAAVQQRLWKLLRTQPPEEVIVAPVLVGDRVVNLLYAHPLEGERVDAEKRAHVDAACNAASAAFIRLLRERSATR